MGLIKIQKTNVMKKVNEYYLYRVNKKELYVAKESGRKDLGTEIGTIIGCHTAEKNNGKGLVKGGIVSLTDDETIEVLDVIIEHDALFVAHFNELKKRIGYWFLLLGYYVKQLFPLTYVAVFKKDGKKYVVAFKMWFFHAYDSQKFEVIEQKPVIIEDPVVFKTEDDVNEKLTNLIIDTENTVNEVNENQK